MYNRDHVNPPPSADDCGNGEGQDRETVLTKHRSERWFLKERATKLGEEVHNDVVSAAERWRGCDLYKTTVVTDTHTHSAHRACRSGWGVGGGREGHIQNMVLCRCRSMKVVAEVVVYISGRLNLSLISKWEKCMLGIWLILVTL